WHPSRSGSGRLHGGQGGRRSGWCRKRDAFVLVEAQGIRDRVQDGVRVNDYVHLTALRRAPAEQVAAKMPALSVRVNRGRRLTIMTVAEIHDECLPRRGYRDRVG